MPLITSSSIQNEMNNALTGLTTGALDSSAWSEHFALHTWLRAQNEYHSGVQLSSNLMPPHALKHLQAALLVVQKILLESDDGAQSIHVPFSNPNFFNETTIQQNLKGMTEEQFKGYAKPFDPFGTMTYRGYAELLLNDINDYIAHHDLSVLGVSPDKITKIQQQVGILKNAQASLVQRITLTKTPTQNPLVLGLDFTLRASVLLFTLPFVMMGSFFYAGLTTLIGKSLRNARGIPSVLKPVESEYWKRVDSNLADDKLLVNNNFVRVFLTLVSSVINAITGAVFVPLRWLVSYDSWDPQNQGRLDALEKGIYNVLIAPFQAVLSTIFHVARNLYRTWADTDNVIKEIKDGNLSADQDYGLGFFRLDAFQVDSSNEPLKWYQFAQKPGFGRGLARVLNLLLLPVDLIVGATFSALRCVLAYPVWSEEAKGTVRLFETGVYSLAAAAWLGFMTVMLAPLVLASIGPAIAWPIAQALVSIHNLIWGTSVTIPSIGAMVSTLSSWSIANLTGASGAAATLFVGLGQGIVTAATGVWTGMTAVANAMWGFVTQFSLALFAQNVFAPTAAAGSTAGQLATMARLMTFVGGGLAVIKGFSVAFKSKKGVDGEQQAAITQLNGLRADILTVENNTKEKEQNENEQDIKNKETNKSAKTNSTEKTVLQNEKNPQTKKTVGTEETKENQNNSLSDASKGTQETEENQNKTRSYSLGTGQNKK